MSYTFSFRTFFIAWPGSVKPKLLTQPHLQREQLGLLLEQTKVLLEAVLRMMKQPKLMEKSTQSRNH